MKADKSSIQKEYTRLAEDYDERWHFYVERTHQETLKKIELSPGDSLLDIGCGTGALLASIEKKYPDVVLAGVDSTKKMLDVASKRLSNDVHIEKSWAEKLPFETEAFDVVISCSMLHYIREPANALNEMARVLKPAGKVIITDWCNDYITNQWNDLFLRIFNKAHFKTYRKNECSNLLLSAGFDEIKIESYKINWFWGMMTATARKGC